MGDYPLALATAVTATVTSAAFYWGMGEVLKRRGTPPLRKELAHFLTIWVHWTLITGSSVTGMIATGEPANWIVSLLIALGLWVYCLVIPADLGLLGKGKEPLSYILMKMRD